MDTSSSTVWFWVGHTTANKLNVEGPFESEDEAVECDVQATGEFGQENFVRRHTCPVLRIESTTWKRKLILDFARQKKIRRDKERHQGNTTSQFRDIYGHQ